MDSIVFQIILANRFLTVNLKSFFFLGFRMIPGLEAYLNSCQTSKMERFAEIVNGF